MNAAVSLVLARHLVKPEQGWDDQRGRAVWTRLFSQGETPTNSMTAGVAELAQGGFLAPHRHPQAEIYYLLNGQGTVTVDGVAHIVGAGTALFIPGGSEHAIRNDASEPLQFLYVFAVDRIEDVAYTFS
jgi:quercetin dioxygenase-like cupin family protein